MIGLSALYLRLVDENTFRLTTGNVHHKLLCSAACIVQYRITYPDFVVPNELPAFTFIIRLMSVSESFTFHHDCRDNGIVVSVESKFQYTGALYGLYDFFTCRIEPKNETRFSLFFPYSSYSKNCTDSYSEKVNFTLRLLNMCQLLTQMFVN